MIFAHAVISVALPLAPPLGKTGVRALGGPDRGYGLDMDEVRFVTRVEIPEGQVTATMFEAPVDMRATFGRARPPLLVTVNGHTYRTTPGVYGGRAYVPVNRANRAAAGVQAGDEIEVVLALDREPRTVDVPTDLAAALAADQAAQERFAAMSYSHRREYVDWIEQAKRPQTRARRVTACVERVRTGRPQR